jgi:polyphenol oxidase
MTLIKSNPHKGEFVETKFGFRFESDKIIYLFGNKNANIENLKKEFPDLVFSRIKQVHGDEYVLSKVGQDLQLTADAHFTYDRKLGLCINTADCIPILVYDSKLKIALAVHAGWRGVANRILPKSLVKIQKIGAEFSDINVFIGPHILFESFEVGADVRDQLLKSINVEAKNFDNRIIKSYSKDKFLVNLLELIKIQLGEFKITENQLKVVVQNTFTNSNFHSFRRDKEKSGRQISFIAMK